MSSGSALTWQAVSLCSTHDAFVQLKGCGAGQAGGRRALRGGAVCIPPLCSDVAGCSADDQGVGAHQVREVRRVEKQFVIETRFVAERDLPHLATVRWGFPYLPP